MRYTWSIVLVILFVACQPSASEGGNNVDTTSAKANPETHLQTEACYRRIMSRDTANIRLSLNGTQVTGQLAYNFFEKDDNTGLVTGNQQDSMLLLQYTFQSEGTTSVREVAFMMRNGTLLEGTGPYNNTGDTLRFTNPSQLSFSGEPFLKVDCSGKF